MSFNGKIPSVQFLDVSKNFGDFAAVRNLDLSVEKSEFFTLLGPSGCGKTTTLRMVAGFEQPTSGQILLDNVDIAGLPPFRRPTNTVFQSYALFPHLSIEENIAFGLKRKRVDRSEIKRRVSEELDRVGLSAEAKRRPAQLSGGQQQRVALARALVNLPTVLLLDEPLGALDLKLRKGLQLELKRIQREVGITFIYVTHDQEEALTMSDRIAIMDRGNVEQVGAPRDVYERPATTFVAGFIGVSNLMPGEIVSIGKDGVDVRLESGPTVRVDSEGFSLGQRCHGVVRPEKLSIVTPGEQVVEGRPLVKGKVASSVYLGTSTQVIVELTDGIRVTVLVPNTEEDTSAKLPGAGSDVGICWDSQHMHLVREATTDGGT